MFRSLLVALLATYAAAFNGVQTRITKKVAVGFFAGALALAPAVMAKDIENGAQVFQGNCAACHAGGNNVIQNEKTLRKEALEQYLAGGLKEASIVTQVTNGKNAMPAFGGRLDADEIEDVAAYVFDQATNSKWD
jgi:cytochrome c6